MQTLSFGYKKPQTNDKAAVVFPALEDNFQRLNDHNHDGVNSAAISASSLASTVVAVSGAGWGADLGGGMYRQVVNMSPGIAFDTATVEVRTSTGERIYPRVVKISAGQFYVYVTDNTLALNVLIS